MFLEFTRKPGVYNETAFHLVKDLPKFHLENCYYLISDGKAARFTQNLKF